MIHYHLTSQQNIILRKKEIKSKPIDLTSTSDQLMHINRKILIMYYFPMLNLYYNLGRKTFCVWYNKKK